MYCNYHAGIFPVFGRKMSIRNKLLNQQESGNGKSSPGLGAKHYGKRSPFLLSLGSGARGQGLLPLPSLWDNPTVLHCEAVPGEPGPELGCPAPQGTAGLVRV